MLHVDSSRVAMAPERDRAERSNGIQESPKLSQGNGVNVFITKFFSKPGRPNWGKEGGEGCPVTVNLFQLTSHA